MRSPAGDAEEEKWTARRGRGSLTEHDRSSVPCQRMENLPSAREDLCKRARAEKNRVIGGRRGNGTLIRLITSDIHTCRYVCGC